MSNITTIRELLAHAKIYPSILYRKHWAVHAALAAANEGDKPGPLCELKNGPDYALFRDQPGEMMQYPIFRKFHGIDAEIAHLVNAIRQAQRSGELSGQIIGLEGPVGTGKSTFAYTIGRAMYARHFYSIKCPWHENPLNAVPLEERELRPISHEDEAKLSESEKDKRLIASYFRTKQELRGELCSTCSARLHELTEKKDPTDLTGRAYAWQELEVEERPYRFGAGSGLLRIERNLVEMKDARIPDEWFSALKCANGGVLFVNFEKVPTEFKFMISGLVSEGFVNGPDLTEVSLDLVVIAVGNKSAKSASYDEAVKDRIAEFRLPYPRRLKSLVAIGKEIQGLEPPKYHLMPHVNEAFWRLVGMSRQETGRGSLDIPPEDRFVFQCGGIVFDKSKMAFMSRTYAELKQGYPNDGSSTGISTRTAGKLLDETSRYGACITLENVLSVLRMVSSDLETSVRERLKELMAFERNAKGEYDKKTLYSWYEEQVRLDLARAWLGPAKFAEQEEADFKYYLLHAGAYKNKARVFDDRIKKEGPPDESFLRKIEDQLGVGKSNEDKFREIVINFFSDMSNHGIPECLSDLAPLQAAIRLNIMRGKKGENMSIEDHLKAMFHPKPTESDPMKDRKNRERVRKHLAELGYRDCCIQKVEGQAERIFDIPPVMPGIGF